MLTYALLRYADVQVGRARASGHGRAGAATGFQFLSTCFYWYQKKERHSSVRMLYWYKSTNTDTFRVYCRYIYMYVLYLLCFTSATALLVLQLYEY